MRKLIEKVDNKVLRQAKTINRDALQSFVNDLDASPTNYEITVDQLNTLKNFYDDSYINFDEPFLKLTSLYGADRKDNIKNFAYTTRILSIITNDTELNNLYKSNKANKEQVEQLRSELKSQLDPAQNNNYVFSTSKIREIVNDFDGRYKRLSAITPQDTKLDTSDIEDSWQLFALQVWKLLSNVNNNKLESNKKKYAEANISSEYRKLIENCIIIIMNALQVGDGKSIQANDIRDIDNIQTQINTLLKANEIKSSQISNINIDDLITLISTKDNKEQPKQPEQEKQQSRYMVYKSKSGGAKDINGNPVLLYDKDGNPVTLAQTEVEHYVGNSV